MNWKDFFIGFITGILTYIGLGYLMGLWIKGVTGL